MEHVIIHKSIAIAALARNCESNLPGNIRRIETLRTYFDNSFVFVYENDSTDSTKEILEHWATHSDNVIIKQEHLEPLTKDIPHISRFYHGVSLHRMNRMSFCRNCLFSMIRENCKPDYVLFIDSDILSFSVEGIVKAIINAPADWGALFANSFMTYTTSHATNNIPIYYDTFPYVATHRDIQTIRAYEISLPYRFYLSKRLYNVVQGNRYFQCASAFGGIGIYHFNSIQESCYQTLRPANWKNEDIALCEHISFNMGIKASKYISQDIHVCYADYPCKGIKGWLLQHFPSFYVLIGILRDII